MRLVATHGHAVAHGRQHGRLGISPAPLGERHGMLGAKRPRLRDHQRESAIQPHHAAQTQIIGALRRHNKGIERGALAIIHGQVRKGRDIAQRVHGGQRVVGK